MNPVLFAMPGNETLTVLLSRAGQWDAGQLEIRRFPDGESYIRLLTDVNGRDVAFVCTLDCPDEKIMPLYLAAGIARELGARRVGLIAPYLAYMRQDARFHDGEGVTSVHFARFISGFCDWLVTVDPHLHRHRDLAEIYTIPTRVVHAAPLIADWVARDVAAPVIVGPDSESEQWVAEVARGAGCAYSILEKTRHGDHEVEISIPDTATWNGLTPVLVDDIVSTASTLRATVAHLNAAGFESPVCIVVHPLFADGAFAALQAAGVKTIVSCNTVAHVTNRIDLSGWLVKAIAEVMKF